MTSIEEWILKKKPDRDPCGANVDSMNSASNHREKKNHQKSNEKPRRKKL